MLQGQNSLVQKEENSSYQTGLELLQSQKYGAARHQFEKFAAAKFEMLIYKIF